MNVYTPKGPRPALGWPIMVWIHGSGLVMGSVSDPSMNSSFLVSRQKVVVFAANYRLGFLGYTVTAAGRDGAYLANNGFRDQQLAFRWARQHGRAFGGNPNQVTIFGESAGGQSICLHMVSPLSAGLFDAAIAQSPDASHYFSLQEALNHSRTVAQHVGCEGAEDLSCLRKVPWHRFVDGIEVYGMQKLIGPVVDADAADPLLPASPTELIHLGQFHRVPFVIGTTWREGDGIVYPPFSPTVQATAGDVRCALARTVGMQKAKQLASVLPVDDVPGIDNRPVVSEIFGDLLFGCGARSFGLALAEQGAAPWFYLFDRHSTPQCTYMSQGGFIPIPGAGHGLDVPYTFDSIAWLATNPPSHFPTNTSCDLPAEDLALSHWTAKLFADFAHSGKMPGGWSTFGEPDESALWINIGSPEGHLDMVMGRFRTQCDAFSRIGMEDTKVWTFYYAILECQEDRAQTQQELSEALDEPPTVSSLPFVIAGGFCVLLGFVLIIARQPVALQAMRGAFRPGSKETDDEGLLNTDI